MSTPCPPNPPILSGATRLQDLDLCIWPERDFSDPALLDRPLVVLLHGTARTQMDMTNPTSLDALYPYDVDFVPANVNVGWRPWPPSLLGTLAELIATFATSHGMGELQSILGGNLVLSPRMTGDQSWFTYFCNRNFPVLAYSMVEAGTPMDSGSYVQFQTVMEELDTNILNDGLQGMAGCKKIALVGHSRGGLMARRYVVEALAGLLGPQHEDIVARRICFLGTLNSPHYGSYLAGTPDVIEQISSTLVPLPVVDDIVSDGVRALVDAFVGATVMDPAAADELSPWAPLIVQMLARDTDLIANDPRMARIRRASTGSSAPVLRRLFGYVFAPSSFVGHLTPFGMIFHHVRRAINVPLSPILEEVGQMHPTAVETAELLGVPIPPTAHELRAHGRDHVTQVDFMGGDLLVGDTMAHMPGPEQHRRLDYHHGAPLWHQAYKAFMGPLVPTGYCHPGLQLLVGDNVVEIKWPQLTAAFRPYRLYRSMNAVASLLIETAQTRHYDPIDQSTALSYELTYPLPGGNWVPYDESDATYAGILPVTIRTIRRESEAAAGYGAVSARPAITPLGGGYVVLLAGRTDILSERLKPTLQPTRARISVFSDGMRVSAPWCEHESGDSSIASWLTFGFPTVAADVNVPGSSSSSSSGVGILTDTDGIGITDSSSGTTVTFTNRGVFVFSLYAGRVRTDGTIPEPVRLAQGNQPALAAERAIIDGSTSTLDAPRFIRVGKRRLFAFVLGPQRRLFLQFTDLALHPDGPLSAVPVGDGAPGTGAQIQLFDLFVREGTKWNALVGGGGTTLYVIAGDGMRISAISSVTLNSRVTGCLGAYLGDFTSLYLFPSGGSEGPPAYASVTVSADGAVRSPLTWRRYPVPGIPASVVTIYHDLARRCPPTTVDLLVSTTGYFEDSSLSSSLHRFRYRQSGATHIVTHHHSAYGRYSVAFSRSDQPQSKAGCAWHRIHPSPFGPGLYGQVILGVEDCDALENGIGVDFGIIELGILAEGLLDKLRRLGLVYGDELARALATPDFVPTLLAHHRSKDRTLRLLADLKVLIDVEHGDDPSRGAATRRVEAQIRNWLDGLHLYLPGEWDKVAAVAKVSDWRAPSERATKVLDAIWGSRDAPRRKR